MASGKERTQSYLGRAIIRKPSEKSDRLLGVEVGDRKGIGLDKIPARLDLVAH